MATNETTRKVIIAETSWRLLHAAVRAIEARYGGPV